MTNIKKLEQGIREIEPIMCSVHICFTALEHERWKSLKGRLLAINKKLKIQEFGRIALYEMLDNVEKLVNDHESKIPKKSRKKVPTKLETVVDDVTPHIDAECKEVL